MSMNKQEVFIIGVLCAIALAGALYSNDGSVVINDNISSEKAALAHAKIGLAQAIYTAERQVQGKASKGQLEDVNGTVVYNVEVIHGNKAEDVKVDVKTGKVLDVRAHTHKIVFPDPFRQ